MASALKHHQHPKETSQERSLETATPLRCGPYQRAPVDSSLLLSLRRGGRNLDCTLRTPLPAFARLPAWRNKRPSKHLWRLLSPLLAPIPSPQIWQDIIGRAIGAGVARFLHTEEVTGSIPVSPTVRGKLTSRSPEAWTFAFTFQQGTRATRERTLPNAAYASAQRVDFRFASKMSRNFKWG